MNYLSVRFVLLIAVMASLLPFISTLKLVQRFTRTNSPNCYLKRSSAQSNSIRFMSSSSSSSSDKQSHEQDIQSAQKKSSSASSSTHKGFGSKTSAIDPNRFKTDPKIVVPNMESFIKETSFQKLVEDYQAVPATSGSTSSNASGRRVFDDALKFPCAFNLKIIGQNDDTFVNDVLGNIASIVGVSAGSLSYSVRESASSRTGSSATKIGDATTSAPGGGKYVSLTVTATFSSADQLYAAYDIPKLDKRIKYVI